MTRMHRSLATILAVDGAIALGFAAISLIENLLGSGDLFQQGNAALNIVLGLLTALPLVFRRVRPQTTLIFIFGLNVVANIAVPHALSYWGGFAPMVVALYSAARWGLPRYNGWILLAPAAQLATFWIHTPDFRNFEDFFSMGAVFLVGWLAGVTISRLDRQRTALDAALAQLTADEEERRRGVLLQERTRIAREMHDVVAHGVSVMVVQAGAARMELDSAVDVARTSLLAVEQTGRDVLTELRRTVSLLRTGDDGVDAAAPAPHVADLEDLAASMRRAGLTVELDVELDGDLDPGRGLAVYRIVQEALTNVLRHSGRTRATVRVRSHPELTVEVVDDGPRFGGPRAVPGPSGGHGLVGMRERAAVYGGGLHASPHGSGFRVAARIPAAADA